MRYIFKLMEKDFDEEVHSLTGIFDTNGLPVIRMKTIWPVGFGRHNEWRSIDQPVTSPDSGSSF